MNQESIREGELDALGASPSEKDELLAYNENMFDHSGLGTVFELPLPDEPFVSAWEGYQEAAEKNGACETLKGRLVQLSFPIEKGISQTDPYRSATRKGIEPGKIPEATGLILKRPDEFRFHLHETPAGPIPILITAHRDDFVAILRALTMRNEPEDVPEATGAMIVSGYNNWDRIRTLRKSWEADHPDDFGGIGWAAEFQDIISQKELYQDKFIILSNGPYSMVAAREMGLSEPEWKAASLTIRREHECTHYVTRHVLHSMQNRFLDELIADYVGIVAAAGCFKADWFLRFMGLENFPYYRQGGRLENYRGDPPLSNGAFRILRILAQRAAVTLERFDVKYRPRLSKPHWKSLALFTLTRLTIEEMASEQGMRLLSEAMAWGKELTGQGKIPVTS
jgi:hypothetical protein